jgi:threonine/homoserine/homoserine lactone efflux protein
MLSLLMNLNAVLALALFAFVSSITPGPNNFMLLSSGVRFGFSRTIAHMLGVSFGFGFMLCAVYLGVHQTLAQLPWLLTIMKWLGIGYLLWFAVALARDRTPINTASPLATNTSSKPMTFLGACAFQWINPKAWWMAVTASSTYVPALGFNQTDAWLGAFWLSLIFVLVNIPSVSAWAWGGTQLRRFLSNPQSLQFFNLLMAALLVASIVPITLA